MNDPAEKVVTLYSTPTPSETVMGGILSEDELHDLELEFPDGLTTEEVLETLERFGCKMTQPTLRSYIQHHLVSRARRTGSKGPHSGSFGLYPACVVWQVMFVRHLMHCGYKMTTIKASRAWQQVVSIQGTHPRFSSLLGEVREDIDEDEPDIDLILMDEATRALIVQLRRVLSLALRRVKKEFPGCEDA